MNAKKLFAIFAVAVMLIAPAACMVCSEVKADSTSNGELKEGVHIHLKDLNGVKFAALFGDKIIGEEEEDDYTAILFAILAPGLNPVAFDEAKLNPVGSETDVKINSIDFDVSHYVSDDKTKMTLKIAAKIDIDHMKFGIKLADSVPANTPALIEPQKKNDATTNEDPEEPIDPVLIAYYLSQYTFKGDYADKMKKDLGNAKLNPGQVLDFNISGSAEVYAESSFQLFKGANNVLYFKNGGYLIPVDSLSPSNGEEETSIGSIPITKVEGKANLTMKTKISDKNVEIKNSLDGRFSCDYKREYTDAENTIKDGSVYRDKFSSTPQAYIKHSVSYNGSGNGTALNVDISNAIAMIADGQYFKVNGGETGKNNDYFTNDYKLFQSIIGTGEGQINYASFITNAKGETEEAKNNNAKDLMISAGAKEGSDGYSMKYDDANGTADSIKNSIEGGSSNNTMTIIAIVIAVIVVLALIALWYFKFRPTSAAPVEQPQNENQ